MFEALEKRQKCHSLPGNVGIARVEQRNDRRQCDGIKSICSIHTLVMSLTIVRDKRDALCVRQLFQRYPCINPACHQDAVICPSERDHCGT